MRSTVHWTSDGRRVSATTNANTEVITRRIRPQRRAGSHDADPMFAHAGALFETGIEDHSSVRRWQKPDDLTAAHVDQFATMIAVFLKGDEG